MVLSGSSKPTSTARPPGCGPACRRTRRFTTSPCAATRRGGDGGAERRTPPVGAALRQLAVAQAAPSYAASARKQPYCFRLRGERPWAFAGLWERWQGLRKGGHASDWLFLAMAHHKLGNRDEARKWYDRAVGWLAKNEAALATDKVEAEELRRFRREAEDVLELKKK